MRKYTVEADVNGRASHIFEGEYEKHVYVEDAMLLRIAEPSGTVLDIPLSRLIVFKAFDVEEKKKPGPKPKPKGPVAQ